MIKATIVLLAAQLLIPVLRRRSAAERHALWTAGLAIAALLPVLAWLLPSWEPAWAQRVAETWPAAFDGGSSAVSAGDVVVRATGIESSRWTLAGALPWLWTAGIVVSLFMLVRQAMQLRRLISSAVAVGGRHSAVANRIAESLGLPTPHLARSEAVHIPLAWGVRRAHVLLPRSSQDWPEERLWAVCAHEFAHISRGDWITHLLAEIACRIYWFNPLFWMARNRLRRDSERAADDIVIGLGASGAEYASHLLEIVRAARRDDGLATTVAMARLRVTRFGGASPGSGLERRVAALLNALVNRTRVSRGLAIAILAGACVIAGPLAALSARGRSDIEIRTSNLPPLDGTAVREFADDDSEPVRDIRVLGAIAGDIAPSVAEYTTPPLYSDEARRGGIEGAVVAQAHIDVNGHVGAARITAGLGFGLDQNALVALRQWRFRPGTRHGVARAMDVAIEIGFTLRNESINAQIANDMVSLVGPGVTPPQAVRVVNVRSPRVGAAGTVVLDVVLLEDGTPRIVRILRSLGADADDIAVRAFEQWRFSPAQKDGRPIKVRMNAEVRFHG
jgi:TonB family protein